MLARIHRWGRIRSAARGVRRRRTAVLLKEAIDGEGRQCCEKHSRVTGGGAARSDRGGRIALLPAAIDSEGRRGCQKLSMHRSIANPALCRWGIPCLCAFFTIDLPIYHHRSMCATPIGQFKCDMTTWHMLCEAPLYQPGHVLSAAEPAPSDRVDTVDPPPWFGSTVSTRPLDRVDTVDRPPWIGSTLSTRRCIRVHEHGPYVDLAPLGMAASMM